MTQQTILDGSGGNCLSSISFNGSGPWCYRSLRVVGVLRQNGENIDDNSMHVQKVSAMATNAGFGVDVIPIESGDSKNM